MIAETHSYLERVWNENPFDGSAARRHSSYAGCCDGELVRLLETRPPAPFAITAHEAFREFVLGSRFSCLAGRSAVRRETYRIGAYERFDDPDVTEGLARDLFAFAGERAGFGSDFTTFVAFFRRARAFTEADFERRLWSQLQRLHDCDVNFHAWDPRVDEDPSSSSFSFSFAGQAFFVVGLHAQASRSSRRFLWTTLVFNAHEQFEHLKASGSFHRLQGAIRKRELAIDGSINPNLAPFGSASEARQYSGRHVPEGWRCPFRPRS